MMMAMSTKSCHPLEGAARERFLEVRVVRDLRMAANIAEAAKAGFFAGLHV